MARVVVTKSADADFDELVNFLFQEAGRGVAVKYEARIDEFYTCLIDNPKIGSRRRALGSGVRIGVIQPYIVIYRYSRQDDVGRDTASRPRASAYNAKIAPYLMNRLDVGKRPKNRRRAQ